MTTQPLSSLATHALQALKKTLQQEFDLIAANRLALDLSRGKPGAEQLALSEGLDDCIDGNYTASDGTDVRNYGGLRGLPEARALGAQLLEVPLEAVIAGGNSSLHLMHLVTSTAMSHGLWQDERAWSNAEAPKILTPVPGYDRHFALSESLGIGMINLAMDEHGPDMEAAQKLVAEDPSIKGIWCVPKYSNPTGATYSPEVVDALAALPESAAADDFVVLWDNAYTVHHLSLPGDSLASIYAAAQARGTEDHVVQFASTSKITFAGSGVAFIASSGTVLDALSERLSFMTIGPDKVNQLRHARFLDGRLEAHMQAHAEILRPKFDIVQNTLQSELGGWDIATWSKPLGGYFVSLDVLPGLAEEIVQMAASVGLTLTPAGATFPYGNDPDDTNVRIAPTFASQQDLQAAMHVLTLCVKLASVDKQLQTAS